MYNKKFWKQFAIALVLFMLGYWTTQILFSGPAKQAPASTAVAPSTAPATTAPK
ncbi:hypothetical protein BH11PSE11_BH11PSE11_36440 [soil metagenome]